jgi:hypothetical protein
VHGTEGFASGEQTHARLVPAAQMHQGHARFKDVFVWIVQLFEALGDPSEQMRDNCGIFAFNMETHARVLLPGMEV